MNSSVTHHSVGKSLKTFSPLYLFLISELFALRYFFHQVLSIRIGWPGTHDYDLVLPCTFAFFSYFFVLSRHQKPEFKFRIRAFAVHLSLVFLFLVITPWLSESGLLSSMGYKIAWFSVLGGIFFSGLTSFLPARFFFQNPGGWAAIPCILIGLSVVLYQKNFEVLWPIFGNWTASLVCKGLPLVAGKFAHCELNHTPDLILKTRYYRATLAPGCVGLDGQFLNVLCFLLLMVYQQKGFSLRKGLFLLLGGSLGLFCLNVVRVLFLFYLGHLSTLSDWWAEGGQFVRFAFHSHLGWILYSVYLVVFYRWTLTQMSSKKRTSRTHPQPVKKLGYQTT